MSVHTFRSMEKSRDMGGYAGEDCAAHLWKLSKRELIEVALRLGEICDEGDGYVARVDQEISTLRENGII